MSKLDQKTLELIRSARTWQDPVEEKEKLEAAQEVVEEKKEEPLDPDKLQGCIEQRNKEGVLMQRVHYRNGKRNGIAEIFVSGRLAQKINFLEDLIEGKVELFDRHEKKTAEITYTQGKKNGSAVFYKNNMVMQESQYKDNLLDGHSVHYYPNSTQKSMEVVYKDGLFEGEMVTYTDGGFLARMTTYTKGLRHGQCISYYPTGEVLEESMFSEDIPCGVTVQYYPNKVKKFERYFNTEGKPVRDVLYDFHGVKISDTKAKEE